MSARDTALEMLSEGNTDAAGLAESAGCTETHASRVLRALRREGAVEAEWVAERELAGDRLRGDVTRAPRLVYALAETEPKRMETTPKRSAILEALEGGGQTTKELSDQLYATKPGLGSGWSEPEVYRIARELESGGLIQRDGYDESGRVIWAAKRQEESTE